MKRQKTVHADLLFFRYHILFGKSLFDQMKGESVHSVLGFFSYSYNFTLIQTFLKNENPLIEIPWLQSIRLFYYKFRSQRPKIQVSSLQTCFSAGLCKSSEYLVKIFARLLFKGDVVRSVRPYNGQKIPKTSSEMIIGNMVYFILISESQCMHVNSCVFSCRRTSSDMAAFDGVLLGQFVRHQFITNHAKMSTI